MMPSAETKDLVNTKFLDLDHQCSGNTNIYFARNIRI